MAAGSMFIDTLDFAHRQIDTTTRHAKVANFLLGHIKLWALTILAITILRAGASKFHRDAIMLKGISAAVVERRSLCARGDDSSDCGIAVKSLERLGKSVLELNRIALGVASNSARVRASARSFAAASSELYDTISNLRWEFLELEATMSPIAEGYFASSPEELEKVFARIISE
jgi:hypothetical protein